MASEERYLWLIQYQWNGMKRLWWTYFKDESEVQACLAEILKAFPCFALQKLEACPDGLRVLDQYYAWTSSSQERADAMFKEMACQRDRQFFPLAPCTCEYLASFRAGLGEAVGCSHSETPSPARSVVR